MQQWVTRAKHRQVRARPRLLGEREQPRVDAPPERGIQVNE
jgi:hypothetical protein